MWWSLASAALGAYSAYSSTRAAQKTAEAAAADAKDQRMRIERRAADTKQALGTEIDTMRQLRSLSSPAYQQAAQIAFLQAKKGSERMARNRAMGRLAPEVRDAIFGGQFQQYVGREGQKIQRYAQMTESIYGMAQQQQAAVNQVLAGSDAAYAENMRFANQMRYEAGDPWAKVTGAFAQGASLQASQLAQMERLRIMMSKSGKGGGGQGGGGQAPFFPSQGKSISGQMGWGSTGPDGAFFFGGGAGDT